MRTFAAALILFASVTTGAVAQQIDWSRYSGVVLVLGQKRPGFINKCSGVAVGRRAVLTAAHCAEGLQAARIFYGIVDEDRDENVIEVADWMVHSSYDRERSYYHGDVALLRLKADLPSSIRHYKLAPPQNFHGITSMLIDRVAFRGSRFWTRPQMRGTEDRDAVLVIEDHAAQSGDSGSPIFIEENGEPHVLAIHSTWREPHTVAAPLVDREADWLRRAIAR